MLRFGAAVAVACTAILAADLARNATVMSYTSRLGVSCTELPDTVVGRSSDQATKEAACYSGAP